MLENVTSKHLVSTNLNQIISSATIINLISNAHTYQHLKPAIAKKQLLSNNTIHQVNSMKFQQASQ